MKTVYIVKQSIYNGTVLLKSDFSVYESLELAEQVRDRIDELNTQNASEFFTVTTAIESAVLYETENEVPILNE